MDTESGRIYQPDEYAERLSARELRRKLDAHQVEFEERLAAGKNRGGQRSGGGEMSADNWAICPRCLKKTREEHDKRIVAVMATYGHVPVEEFDAARAAIVDIDTEKLRTFREDYEFYGAEDGEVVASYSGGCDRCDLRLEFRVERKLSV